MIPARIDRNVDKRIDLTSYMVDGEVTAERIISTITRFYRTAPTRRVLWNFSTAHVHHLKGFEIERIADIVRSYAEPEFPFKTALVFGSKADFGIGRMFETLSQVNDNPYDIMCFYTLEEAIIWLDE